MSITFAASKRMAIGVEWELALIDPATGDLVPRAQELVEWVRAQDPDVHLELEFLDNTIEIVTGVCANTTAALGELAHAHQLLQQGAEMMGVKLWTSGSHPSADWHDQKVSNKDTYTEIIERTQYWGRQMLIWGLHVHVGVTHVEKVWPIINGLMTQLPVLLGLSASSPAWMGEDTGYASNRSMLYQQLPTAGIPYTFRTWEEYEQYMVDQQRSGVISHTGNMHFDIRPADKLGTVEIRVCDSPSNLAELGALVALMHCLAVYYDRQFDAIGAEAMFAQHSLPYWHNLENKWRAARYGIDAEIIRDRDTNESTVKDAVEELLRELTPIAQEYDCVEQLQYLRTILAKGAGYQRQLAGYAQTGDWTRVVHATAEECATATLG